MILRPSVLCPVDFSDASRGALRYAAAIAEHFGARLTVMTVNDPLLEAAAGTTFGESWMPEDSHEQLRRFLEQTFGSAMPRMVEVQSDVAVGKPAPEILRVARERACDVIVMGSHGLTGARKLFFGSTTERVLRETSVPVLVSPATDQGPAHLEDVKKNLKRILAPVDLTAATSRQIQVARGIAEAIDASLMLAHVLEPVRYPFQQGSQVASVQPERRDRAERALDELASTLPPSIKPEALVAYGDPAEAIAKISRDRRVGLIVMGLHSSPVAGPRMGSVTYRVLCLAPTLVLALPPVADSSSRRMNMPNEAPEDVPRPSPASS